MVSGTLALKNGYYYAVLSYQDAAGKRHQKWVSTGLPQKGNKRRVEQELIRIRSEFEIPRVAGELSSNMLFADYLDQWLEIVRARIKDFAPAIHRGRTGDAGASKGDPQIGKSRRPLGRSAGGYSEEESLDKRAHL